MTTDVHIHAITEPLTEEDIRIFHRDHLGNKWFGYNPTIHDPKTYNSHNYNFMDLIEFDYINEELIQKLENEVFKKVCHTSDDIFILEQYMGSHEHYCWPLFDLLDEDFPILDLGLYEELILILVTFEHVINLKQIIEWLDEHIGYKLFIVAW